MQIEADAISIHFEIPATDAMGMEHVEGKIQGLEDKLVLHWRMRDRPFTKIRNEITKLEFAYHEIESVELRAKFLRPKTLVLKVCDPSRLEGIPGVSMGQAELVISKKSKADVDKLAKFLDYRISEYRLAHAEARMGALRDGASNATDANDS